MLPRRFILVLVTSLALVRPADASDLAAFNAAVGKAYSHFRGSVFYLRTGNPAVANIELQQAASAWTAEVMPFRAAPPDAFGDDAQWSAVLLEVSERLAKAESLTRSGAIEPAEAELLPIRPTLAALRARNNVRVFSDCIDEANAAMDRLWVFRYEPPDFSVPAQVNKLKAETAITAYLYRRCQAEAPAEIASTPEFTRIMEGTIRSLARMWDAIDQGNEEAVISILREVRSFDRMLWLQFG